MAFVVVLFAKINNKKFGFFNLQDAMVLLIMVFKFLHIINQISVEKSFV
mgnify:CR=1 FL=1